MSTPTTAINDTSIHLSVFNGDSEKQQSRCDTFESCNAINRLITSLCYYQSLDLTSNNCHQNKLIHFMNEIYTHSMIIQDIHHFMKQHAGDLHDIMTYFVDNYTTSQCQIDQCEYANRHHRVNENNRKMSNDIYW